MTLVLTEDETMLADASRGLIDRMAPVSAFRALRDSGSETRHDPALLAQLAENGLVAPNVAEADGGIGLGAAAAGVIAEQAGHSLVAAPLVSAAMAAHLIGRLGDPTQRERWLPAIVAGTSVVAVAIEEKSRHDPAKVEATAQRAGERWTISGAKTAVIDGVGADAFAVSALVEDELRLFVVASDAPGLAVSPIDTIDARNLARLNLDTVVAEPLGDGDAGAAIRGALDVSRALLAAELLGIADEAFDRTIAYLKERVQFGQRIGSFQALQHRAARLYARLDLARGPVTKAFRAIDAGDSDASFLASLSKAVMTRLARDVVAEAVQMHGGIGVTDEFDLGFFFKRARTAGELLGDDLFHTERLASERWGI